jgi:hypothetical protein
VAHTGSTRLVDAGEAEIYYRETGRCSHETSLEGTAKFSADKRTEYAGPRLTLFYFPIVVVCPFSVFASQMIRLLPLDFFSSRVLRERTFHVRRAYLELPRDSYKSEIMRGKFLFVDTAFYLSSH